MQVSAVDVCNMALGNIGQAPIQSMNGPSASQRACSLRYNEARAEALCGSLWNFASLWRVGTALAIDPKPPWAFVFQYPTDALKVFEIQREKGDNTEIPFEVTARPGGDGKLIHCDRPNPTFVYVKDVADPATFNQEFVVALSWLLSSKIAMPLTKSLKVQQEAYKMWISLSSMAKASTANEGRQDTDILAGYQEAR